MTSYLYSVYGQTLASNVALPGRVPTRSSRIDFSFAWKPPRLRSPRQVDWLHHWGCPDGGDWLSAARAGDTYLLRLQGWADFWLSREGRQVRGIPLRSLSRNLLDHMLISHVLPFGLTLRGFRVFHASGCYLRDRAVLFLGDSGSGKSTLAASLLARGFPPLTDDCAVVVERRGKVMALPGQPALRLWPAVEKAVLGGVGRSRLVSGKRTLQLEEGRSFWPSGAVLSRLYVLAPTAGSSAPPALEFLPGPRALIELVSHSLRLDFSDRTLLTRELESLSNLVASVGVRRLRFPPGIAGLEGAAELVLSDLGQ